MANVRLSVWLRGRVVDSPLVHEGERAGVYGNVVECTKNIGAAKLGGPERSQITGYSLAHVEKYQIEDI